MKLSPLAKTFVIHWGEMGSRWGINRTVAQIHALLFLSARPLAADEITETLSVARSNVSASLRELQAWGLVRLVHILGDRRDHFESLKDVWQIFQIVLDERKRREVDPTLALLREAVAEADSAGTEDDYAREKMGEMLQFFESATAGYEQLRKIPLSALRQLLKTGVNLKNLLGTKKKT